MQLLAHVSTPEFATSIATFLIGMLVGQCVALIAVLMAARRGR